MPSSSTTISSSSGPTFSAATRLAKNTSAALRESVPSLLTIGLFARYFLDSMQALCRKHGKDYYDRLTYIAADRSERMLQDVLRHGVLSRHPGRYRVRQVDGAFADRLVEVAAPDQYEVVTSATFSPAVFCRRLA
jgi:hypothetical protein